MTDPTYYTGDDDREFGPRQICEECHCDLYPEEVDRGLCRRCFENALDADDDGEAFRGDEAAGYAVEQHEAERSLK